MFVACVQVNGAAVARGYLKSTAVLNVSSIRRPRRIFLLLNWHVFAVTRSRLSLQVVYARGFLFPSVLFCN